MAETLVLTTPETTTITSYQIASVYMVRLPDWGLTITYRDNQGVYRSWGIYGEDAAATVKALNKINLTVKSLERRAMERLVAEGLVTGAVEGSPD